MNRAPAIALTLLLLAATLAMGEAIKQPCVTGSWGDGRQYKRLCYTDIVPLHGTEHLEGNRLPYLDRCPAGGGECDEYPVLTMYAMRAAAWLGPGSSSSFYYANALLLALCAAVIAACLYLAVGWKALYFVLAPTLVVYGLINWDLIAVAFATAATFAYLRKRDSWSGVLLGLGAAAKFYPALLVVPFALGRFKEGKRRDGITLALTSAIAWMAVNLPFAVAARESWFEFFRFNGARPVDWDSLWMIVNHLRTDDYTMASPSVRAINMISAGVFLALSAAVWAWKRHREPAFPRWTFALPLLILFLLSNKVYSPQYSLWLLPWFALALPDWRLFAAFEVADVGVFLTRFLFFAEYTGMKGGLPFSYFEAAVGIRTLVLIACVIAWVLKRSPQIRPLIRETPAAIPIGTEAA